MGCAQEIEIPFNCCSGSCLGDNEVGEGHYSFDIGSDAEFVRVLPNGEVTTVLTRCHWESLDCDVLHVRGIGGSFVVNGLGISSSNDVDVLRWLRMNFAPKTIVMLKPTADGSMLACTNLAGQITQIEDGM